MTRLDRLVRFRVYRGFSDTGRAPTVASIAAAERVSPHEVRASLRRLEAQHELVLGPGDPGIWMAHPFAGNATDYRVTIAEQRWYANCAWDGLAILALLGDGIVETTDPLTEAPWVYGVDGGATFPEGVVSFPVPARRFWDDIGFT